MVDLINEYTRCLEEQRFLMKNLEMLPEGYLSEKTIRGKQYFYLQRRNGQKIVSKYIKRNSVDNIRCKISDKKRFEKKMLSLKKRMDELEKAASLIDKRLGRALVIRKMSYDIDNLTKDEKIRCTSFSDAMNAIEGVIPDKEFQEQISKWCNGELAFYDIYVQTLREYGFIKED